MEQTQTDVTRMHQESLEMRMVTEELWAQLAGRMAPATLTKSIATLRSKMADHYQLANAHLATQKQELTELGANLNTKYQSLNDQRQNLQQWVNRRNEEIEQQAARLVAREQELERQERQYKQQLTDWEAERLDHQEELRRLVGGQQPQEFASA